MIGNEPNLNLFWRPQFGPRGVDSAARTYELLLARTYDALGLPEYFALEAFVKWKDA